MTSAHLLTDGFDRVQGVVHGAAGGLTAQQLAYRPADGANSIAWLVWHLTRVQDDHVADAAGTAQVWTEDGWDGRFGLPLDASDTGYGHTGDEVAAVQVESAELLTGYHDAVHDRTVKYVSALTDGDLERVVDRAWDPPVTLAVRLVSVISDDLQHAGQASYVRGLLPGG
ncbi:DUF664 domain-containing protein [Actinomadura sp. BRA 177]|uniref:mycothiol transferase n=1 Tax=Actinomadura sp. BRA 177 TaxID=2745202 RepID=UPI0015958E60|nr:DUF664 domain-containing protein [Actinomadura sp. BRA 177]NVI90538.1 DUF664 domain-containing protein [Actinomadura sp. BRA 177]